jgi:uncharacterized protein YacL
MGLILLRLVILIFSGLGGYIIFLKLLNQQGLAIAGAVLGVALGLLAIIFERLLIKQHLKAIIGGSLGLIAGLIAGNLFTYGVLRDLLEEPSVSLSIYVVLNLLLGYIGLVIGAKKGIEFDVSELKTGATPANTAASYKLLDTSVIIDGRIADVCETGFIEGVFLIPQFVLQELQYIADSADSLKRTRGRRGLDILKRMQKMTDLEVRVTDQDFPKIKSVDAKLVALGKKLNAKVITNDFNLNKVAELQGVTVLNLNQLSNALKPVVIPGEFMKLKVIKEGSESNQGVAYLDDGTMVVVDNGKRLIGKTIDTVVTSVLQTTAGRMIFAKPKEENGGSQHQ